MNSALQALLHTPPLIAFLSHMSHIPLDSIRQRLIADFSILLQKVWSGHYSLVAPGDLLRDVVFINPFFRGYGQHDAQELIRCVLDQMHEGLKRCEEYEYTRYVYGEGTGEEQEVRWRERELQKEKEKLMQTVRDKRGGKKGGKETDRKRREREQQQHSTSNGHRHTASVSSHSSTPSTTAPATPTATTAEHSVSSSSSSTASTLSQFSANSSTSSASSAPSASAPSASPSASSTASSAPPDPSKKPVKVWPEHSLISDIFSGYLQSRIRCHQCNTISTVYDQFYDLSLEIPKESNMKRIAAERGIEAMTPPTKQSWLGSLLTYTGLVPPPLSLETSLHAFCTSDRLIDRDQYRCDQCKAKVDASKTLALHSLPEVLMLHVKRFAHNSYFGSKVTRHVNFPINGLDMRPFLSEDKRARMAKAAEAAAAGTASAASADESSLYDLYAVVRHLGSVAGGHYISYAKNHLTGKWYEFDDRVVTEISEKKLAEVEAYVLFYRHRHSESQRKQLLDRIQDATLTAQQPPPTRFISRQYAKKVSVLGRVEPIDNRDLLCVHGVPYELPADGGQLAIPVSKAGWDRLVKQYGGGPLVDGGRYECEQCLIPIIRARERKRISALDNEATHASLPSDPFYLIHDDWLRQWRAFIQEKGQRPGPITNQLLLDEQGVPKPGLVKVRDYRGLHGTVWDELLRCYGGGPVIVRKRLDIYEEEGAALAEGAQQGEEKEEKEGQQARAGGEQQGGDGEMDVADDGEEAEEEEDDTQMVVSFHSSEQPRSPSARKQQAAAENGASSDAPMADDKMEEENKTASPTPRQQSPAAISPSGENGV